MLFVEPVWVGAVLTWYVPEGVQLAYFLKDADQ